MANDTTDSILFSSEFDPADFNKGVEAMIDGLKKMQAEEKRLQDSIAESETLFKERNAQIKEMQDKLKAAGTDTKNYSEENKRLASGMSIVVKQNDELNKKLEKQRQELATTSNVIKDMEKKYSDTEAALKKLQATGNKPIIDSGKIIQDVTKVKDAAVNAGKSVLQNVVTTGSVVEGVTGTINQMGASFGILGTIGAGALTFIITKLVELASAETEAAKQRKLLNDVQNKAAEIAGAGIAKLTLLKKALSDVSRPEQERIASLKEYNDIADKGNQIAQREINNIDLINERITKQIELIQKRALSTAAEQVLSEKATALLKARVVYEDANNLNPSVSDAARSQVFKDAQSQIGKAAKKNKLKSISAQEALGLIVLPDDELKNISQSQARFNVFLDEELRKQLKAAAARLKLIDDARSGLRSGTGAGKIETANDALKAAQKDFDDTAQLLAGYFTPEKEKFKKPKQEIINIYAQELAKIKAEIDKLAEKTFTNEDTITQAVEADFRTREIALEKAFKRKQLTPPQLEVLKENLSNLQSLTLNKQIAVFQKQRQQYLDKINSELEALQEEEALKRIHLLQDDFERERQTIVVESDKTAGVLKRRRDKLIDDMVKDAGKNGLTRNDIQPQINAITSTYAKLLDDLEEMKLQKLQQLSFKTFEKLSVDAQRILTAGNLGVSEGSAILIQQQTDIFLKGKISYDQYQKELTAIARNSVKQRFDLEKIFLNQEIKRRQEKLNTDKSLTGNQRKQLEDEITSLRQRLADLTSGNNQTNAANTEKDRNAKFERFKAYIGAFTSLIGSIGQAWQTATDAEARNIDRSIRLQQRRVDAATRIAERGNASYLKLEQDRMNQLELKQAANAKRTLAINAAIQGSQLLVGITGAIAQIAKGEAINVITGVATIFGALATGYALVKSLQNNQPSFFEGIEDTGPGGNADHRGGFTATLHPHERVVNANDNKKLGGISNKELAEKVSTARMIERMYGTSRIPGLNYDKLEKVATDKTVHDTRLANIMQENAQKMDTVNDNIVQLNKTMKNIGVHFNLDRRGFLAIALDGIKQHNIHKKA